MTLDKNGRTIRTGDLVRIENSPVKNQNGMCVVVQDGTSKGYSGGGLTMYKLAKHKGGYTLSRGKYNIEFWPLSQFSSKRKFDREEMSAATIEVIQGAAHERFTLTPVRKEEMPTGYGFDKPEDDYLRAYIYAPNGDEIEDFAYPASQAELMTAVLSNLTLKEGETLKIVKTNHNWGYPYAKGFAYKLEARESAHDN